MGAEKVPNPPELRGPISKAKQSGEAILERQTKWKDHHFWLVTRYQPKLVTSRETQFTPMGKGNKIDSCKFVTTTIPGK